MSVLVRHLNDNLVCALCNGYFIGAVTVSKCLHSYCYSCLHKYMSKHSTTVILCPRCQHENAPKPTLLTQKRIKKDWLLQSLTYKLVPNLYENECLRRQNYNINNNIQSSINFAHDFKNYKDYDCVNVLLKPSRLMGSSNRPPRYLLTPVKVTLRLMKKLIKSKLYACEDSVKLYLSSGDNLIEDDNLTIKDICMRFNYLKKDIVPLEYIAFIKPRANTSNNITTNTDDNSEGDKDRSSTCNNDRSDISSQQLGTHDNKQGGDNIDSFGGDNGKKRSLECSEDDRVVKKCKLSNQTSLNNNAVCTGINIGSNNINNNSVSQCDNFRLSTQNTANDSTKDITNLLPSMLGFDEKNFPNLNSLLIASLTANAMPNVNNFTNAAPNNLTNQNMFANNQSPFLSFLPASYFNSLIKGLYGLNDVNNAAGNSNVVNVNKPIENNSLLPQDVISNGISLNGNFVNNQNNITDANEKNNQTNGNNKSNNVNSSNVVIDEMSKDTIIDTSTGIHFDKSDSFSGSIDLFPDFSDQNSDINNSLNAKKNKENSNNSIATQNTSDNQYNDTDKEMKSDNNNDNHNNDINNDEFKNTVSPIKIKYVKKSNKTGIYSIDNKEKLGDKKGVKGVLNRSRSKHKSAKMEGDSLMLRDCRVVLKRLKQQETPKGGVDVCGVKNNDGDPVKLIDNVGDETKVKSDNVEKEGESYNSFICDLSENSLKMSIKKNQLNNPVTSSPPSITPIFSSAICSDHSTTEAVVNVINVVSTTSVTTSTNFNSFVTSVTPTITTIAVSSKDNNVTETTNDNIFNILQSTLNDKPKVNKLKMPVKKSLNSPENLTKIKLETSQKSSKSKQFDSTTSVCHAMSKSYPSYKTNKLTDFPSNLVSSVPTTSSLFSRFSSMGPCYFNQKCNKRSSISNNATGVNDAYINFFVNKKSYKNNKLTSKAQLTFFENTFSVNNNFNFLKYQYHSFFPTLTSIGKRKPGTKSPRSSNPNTKPLKCNTSNFYRSSQYLSQLTHPFMRKNNYIMHNNEFEHKAINLKMNSVANNNNKSIGEGETSSLSSLITLTSSLSQHPVSSSSLPSQTPSKSCPPFFSCQPLSHEITKKSLFPIFKKPLKKQVSYSTNATNCGSLDLSYARIKQEKDEDLVEKDVVSSFVPPQNSTSPLISSTSSLSSFTASVSSSTSTTLPLPLTTTVASLNISTLSSVKTSATPSSTTPSSSIPSSNTLNNVAIKCSTNINKSPLKIKSMSSSSDTSNSIIPNDSKTTSTTTVISSKMVVSSEITTGLTHEPKHTTTSSPLKHTSTIISTKPTLGESEDKPIGEVLLSSSSSIPLPVVSDIKAVSDAGKTLIKDSTLSTTPISTNKANDDNETVICNAIVTTSIISPTVTTCSISNANNNVNDTPIVDIIAKKEDIKTANKEDILVESKEANIVKIINEENVMKESAMSLTITSASSPPIYSSIISSNSPLVTSTVPIKESNINKKPINIVTTSSPLSSVLVPASTSIKNSVSVSKQDVQNDSIKKDISRQAAVISNTLLTNGNTLEIGTASKLSVLDPAVTSARHSIALCTTSSVSTHNEVVATLPKVMVTSSLLSPIVSSISTSILLKASPSPSSKIKNFTTTKIPPQSTIVVSATDTLAKSLSGMSTTKIIDQTPIKSKDSDDMNSPSKTKTFIIIQPDKAPVTTQSHSNEKPPSSNHSKPSSTAIHSPHVNGCLSNEAKTCQPNNINDKNVKEDKFKNVSTPCGNNKFKSSSGVSKVIISKSTYTTTILASTFATDNFNNAVNSVEPEETMKSSDKLKQNVDNLENIDMNINNIHNHNMGQTVVINLNDFQ